MALVNCAICNWPAAIEIRVRPNSGGPAVIAHVCSDDCKQQKLSTGFVEDNTVRGWDVFIPMHVQWKLDG